MSFCLPSVGSPTTAHHPWRASTSPNNRATAVEVQSPCTTRIPRRWSPGNRRARAANRLRRGVAAHGSRQPAPPFQRPIAKLSERSRCATMDSFGDFKERHRLRMPRELGGAHLLDDVDADLVGGVGQICAAVANATLMIGLGDFAPSCGSMVLKFLSLRRSHSLTVPSAPPEVGSTRSQRRPWCGPPLRARARAPTHRESARRGRHSQSAGGSLGLPRAVWSPRVVPFSEGVCVGIGSDSTHKTKALPREAGGLRRNGDRADPMQSWSGLHGRFRGGNARRRPTRARARLWPSNECTLDCDFMSQKRLSASLVAMPRMRPSGWNSAHS